MDKLLNLWGDEGSGGGEEMGILNAKLAAYKREDYLSMSLYSMRRERGGRFPRLRYSML